MRDEGAWEPWLSFFLRGVRDVSEEATDAARRLIALREQHRSLITRSLGRRANSGLKLLESLYGGPYLTVNSAVSRAGLSYPQANSLVAAFEELGLLREITGRRRNRFFRYEPYLDLFTDDADDRNS